MADDLLNRLAALERKIRNGLTLARLTLTGAITGAAATFTSLTVNGSATATGGLNVGSATGAGTGEIRASDKLRLGGQTSAGAKMQASTVANNGTVALFSATDKGVLIIEGNNNIGVYVMKGSGNATQELLDPDAVYSVTAATGSSTNVYWSAGNGRYELENKRGGTLTYTITLIGTV